MNTEFHIRIASSSDSVGIAICVNAAYRHYIKRMGKPPGPMLDDYAEIIENHTVFVAELDGIVGVLVLMHSSNNILLDNVAVHPEHQGKGVGKRLITLAESEVVKRGFDEIELYTHEMMKENLEIYGSLGFVETERKNERGYDRIYMRKKLL